MNCSYEWEDNVHLDPVPFIPGLPTIADRIRAGDNQHSMDELKEAFEEAYIANYLDKSGQKDKCYQCSSDLITKICTSDTFPEFLFIGDVTNFIPPPRKTEKANGQPYYPECFDVNGETYLLHAKLFSTAVSDTHYYVLGKMPHKKGQCGVYKIDNMDNACKNIDQKIYGSLEDTNSLHLLEHRNKVFLCYRTTSRLN